MSAVAGQPLEKLPTFRLLHVQRDAPLVGVERKEGGAPVGIGNLVNEGRLVAGLVAPAGRLNLDGVRALVGQQLGAIRPEGRCVSSSTRSSESIPGMASPTIAYPPTSGLSHMNDFSTVIPAKAGIQQAYIRVNFPVATISGFLLPQERRLFFRMPIVPGLAHQSRPWFTGPGRAKNHAFGFQFPYVRRRQAGQLRQYRSLSCPSLATFSIDMGLPGSR